MKILYLGPYREKIVEFLKKYGSVDQNENRLIDEKIISGHYDWIISFGYRHMIKKNIIDFYRNKIINLHISYLPWNRGADPNFWSFFDDTPKGVSIHLIDEGLDTGDILVQQYVPMSSKETLFSSYQKLSNTIENLFITSWDNIINQTIIPKKNDFINKGSFHTSKEFKKYKSSLSNGWETSVEDIRKLKNLNNHKKIIN